MALSIIGFSIILIYTLYIILKCKCIPESISASIYALDENNKWLFRLIMWAVGFMIAPHLFSIVLPHTQFLVWIMIVGLLGIGCDPLDKGDKNIVHYVSAAICGVSSQALVLFNSPIFLLLWGLYVPYTLIWEYCGKNMFFAEIIMIVTIALLSFAVINYIIICFYSIWFSIPQL